MIERGVRLEASNRKAAIRLYRQAQRILIDDAVAIFSVDIKNGMVKRRNIGGYRRNPAYETVFFYRLYKK